MSSFGKKGESYHSVSRISVAFINLIIVRKLIYSYKLTFSQDHLRSTLGITCGRGSFEVHFGDHLRYCTVQNLVSISSFSLWSV